MPKKAVFNAEKYRKHIQKLSFDDILDLFETMTRTQSFLSSAYSDAPFEEATEISALLGRVGKKLDIVYDVLIRLGRTNAEKAEN